MKIKKSVRFLDNVVAQFKTRQGTKVMHWSVAEMYRAWLKTLPRNEPAAQYAAWLAGNHPLDFPENWNPAEHGLTENSTVEDYRLAYERELESISKRKK